MEVPFFFDANKLHAGLPRHASLVYWDRRRAPNLMVIGRSGVGKSVCAQLMLGRVRRHSGTVGAAATVCDFKSEYAYLRNCTRYFDHDRCMDGLRLFAEENERRIREGITPEDPLHVLLFSEWGMFCSVQDKRARDEAVSIIAALIMSVRAQNMSVWLDLQRPDAQFMGTARDSLSPIALGNLSPEGKRMVFPDFADQIEPVGENEGYFSDGVTLRKIIVPIVTRWDKLHEDIRVLVR